MWNVDFILLAVLLSTVFCVQVRSTDDVFAALEDNQVQLSTMKASRFVKAFEQDVDKWERTLSHILEVVEMLLTVQRQWMYLEVGWILIKDWILFWLHWGDFKCNGKTGKSIKRAADEALH